MNLLPHIEQPKNMRTFGTRRTRKATTTEQLPDPPASDATTPRRTDSRLRQNLAHERTRNPAEDAGSRAAAEGGQAHDLLGRQRDGGDAGQHRSPRHRARDSAERPHQDDPGNRIRVLAVVVAETLGGPPLLLRAEQGDERLTYRVRVAQRDILGRFREWRGPPPPPPDPPPPPPPLFSTAPNH